MKSSKIRLERPAISGLGLVAIAFVAIAGTALAHSGATGVVKERMEAMKDIGQQMKAIAAIVRGQAEYDAAVVEESAEIISSHADALPDLFPPDSNAKPSEALDTIWTDWDRFSGVTTELETSANALASKAADVADADGIRDEFAAVAQTCQSCHESFRKSK